MFADPVAGKEAIPRIEAGRVLSHQIRFLAKIAILAVFAGCTSAAHVSELPSLTSPLVTSRAGAQYLYVANLPDIAIFAPGARKPLTNIHRGIKGGPSGMTFDKQGNLYVGHTGQPGSILVYPPGSTMPSQTIPFNYGSPGDLAFDAAGNLYVIAADGYLGAVCVFPPGASTPSRVITRGMDQPRRILFDKAGNLWVLNLRGVGSVNEYAPGGTTVIRRLRGVRGARGMIFDHQGNLYVTNTALSHNENSYVAVYPPGANSPSRRIRGVTAPDYIAVDSSDHVFVAEETGYSDILEFAPGGTKLIRHISQGIGNSVDMIFDDHGNLYASNQPPYGVGWVSVYRNHSRKFLYKITNHVNYPGQMLLGPR